MGEDIKMNGKLAYPESGDAGGHGYVNFGFGDKGNIGDPPFAVFGARLKKCGLEEKKALTIFDFCRQAIEPGSEKEHADKLYHLVINGIVAPAMYGSEKSARTYHNELHTVQAVERLARIVAFLDGHLTKEQILGMLVGMAYHDSIVFLQQGGLSFELSNELRSTEFMLLQAAGIVGADSTGGKITSYSDVMKVAVQTIAVTALRIPTQNLIEGSWAESFLDSDPAFSDTLSALLPGFDWAEGISGFIVACAVYADLGGVFSEDPEERASSTLRHFWETHPDFVAFAKDGLYSEQKALEFLMVAKDMPRGEKHFLNNVSRPRFSSAFFGILDESTTLQLLPMFNQVEQIVLELEERLPIAAINSLMKELEPSSNQQKDLDETQKAALNKILGSLHAPNVGLVSQQP